MFDLEIGTADGRSIDFIERACWPVPRKGELIHTSDGRKRVTEVIHAVCENRVSVYVEDVETKPEEVSE